MRLLFTLCIMSWGIALGIISLGTQAQAGIHRAPIIIKGKDIRAVTRYPIDMIHVYRTNAKGEAEEIPFQIDEVNNLGDYVMDQGPTPNAKTGNGIFDDQDELAFMGDDVGLRKTPTKWPRGAPNLMFELRFYLLGGGTSEDGQTEGAVYIGVHFERMAPTVNYKYVVYDPIGATVTTSRYRYKFDKRNYLVVEGVDMLTPSGNPSQPIATPMIRSSTFYLKADLKYFLTFTANHRSVDSKLEAFKVGPVRTIVRVSFFYTFLKLNFEAGMYTEVSFFSNSVILPAMMYNPIDGQKSLNRGSGFYYGFTLFDDPSQYDVKTNMPLYEDRGTMMRFFKSEPPSQKKYWISAVKNDRMIYVEIEPSNKMRQDRIYPYYYVNSAPATQLAKIDNNVPNEIEKSRVNIGLYFDITRFAEGEHLMAFQLFFENKKDLKQLDSFINLRNWRYVMNRM